MLLRLHVRASARGDTGSLLGTALAVVLLAAPAAALDGGAALARAGSSSLHTVVASTQPSATVAESSADRARREPKLQWYGWPIAAMDGAGVALTGVWWLDSDDLWPVAIGAGALFTLGAPVTHWLHGFIGRGFLSLGVRSAAMLSFLAGIGSLIAADEDSSVATRGYVLVSASAVGLVAMSIVDLALLAFEPAPQRSVVDDDKALAVTPWLVPNASTYGLHVSLHW